MDRQDAFAGYHPLVNFTYFALVIGFSMCLMHPVCLGISFGAAALYDRKLRGRKAGRFLAGFALPAVLLTALVNPAFNHQGTVILCYLPTGNPLTLESILYGIGAGVLLAAVLLWFQCYTAVMTSDKFVYLFGRIIPVLSLVLSMALRFVPRFKKQFDQVREAQAGIGRDLASGSLLRRMKHAAACFSVMITWALENAIETADSMKSRGYGLKGRTAFSIYRMEERDRAALLWLGFCGLYLLCGSLAGGLYWRYFPSIRGILAAPFTFSLQAVYGALCCTPLLMDGVEEAKWNFLRSKI